MTERLVPKEYAIILLRGKHMCQSKHDLVEWYVKDHLKTSFTKGAIPIVIMAAPAQVTKLISSYLKTNKYMEALLTEIRRYILEDFFVNIGFHALRRNYDEADSFIENELNVLEENLKKLHEALVDARLAEKVLLENMLVYKAYAFGEQICTNIYARFLPFLITQVSGNSFPDVTLHIIPPQEFIKVHSYKQKGVHFNHAIIDRNESKRLFDPLFKSLNVGKGEVVFVPGCLGFYDTCQDLYPIYLGNDGSSITAGVLSHLLPVTSINVFTDFESDRIESQEFIQKTISDFGENKIVFSSL